MAAGRSSLTSTNGEYLCDCNVHTQTIGFAVAAPPPPSFHQSIHPSVDPSDHSYTHVPAHFLPLPWPYSTSRLAPTELAHILTDAAPVWAIIDWQFHGLFEAAVAAATQTSDACQFRGVMWVNTAADVSTVADATAQDSMDLIANLEFSQYAYESVVGLQAGAAETEFTPGPAGELDDGAEMVVAIHRYCPPPTTTHQPLPLH